MFGMMYLILEQFSVPKYEIYSSGLNRTKNGITIVKLQNMKSKNVKNVKKLQENSLRLSRITVELRMRSFQISDRPVKTIITELVK
jgi:hypothetical protein